MTHSLVFEVNLEGPTLEKEGPTACKQTRQLAKLLAGASDAAVDRVYRMNGFTQLVKLAETWNESVQEEAAHALYRICKNNVYHQPLFKLGGIEKLLFLAEHSKKAPRAQQSAAGSLAYMCATKELRIEIVRKDALGVMVPLSNTENVATQIQAGLCIARLSEDRENVNEIVNSEGVQPLVRMCQMKPTGDKQQDRMVQSVACDALASLLQHKEERVTDSINKVRQQ